MLFYFIWRKEDILFTKKLLLEMYAIGIVLNLLSWSTLHTRGLAEQNVLCEAVVATI